MPLSSIIGGALVSGLGGLLGNVVTGYSQHETNQTNLRIARETNDANYRLWQENNAYNTPAAQMSRLQAAGLNPNMVYGQISSGNSSSPATAQGAVMKSAKFGDFGTSAAVMSYLQGQMQKSSIMLQDTQSEKNKAETNKTNVETLNAQKDGLLKDIAYYQKLFDYYKSNNLFPFERRSIEVSIEQKKRDIARIDATIDNLNASTARTTTETELMPKQVEIAQFNAATARINALSMQERNKVLNTLSNLQSNVLRQQMPYISEKESAQVASVWAHFLNTLKSTEKLDADTAISNFEKVYLEKYGVKPSSNIVSSIASAFSYGVESIVGSF